MWVVSEDLWRAGEVKNCCSVEFSILECCGHCCSDAAVDVEGDDIDHRLYCEKEFEVEVACFERSVKRVPYVCIELSLAENYSLHLINR